MTMQEMRDRANRLRGIPLEAVLRVTGAQRDRYDKAKWHTAQGTISFAGIKFMNWNQQVGGGGAIDLAMHLNDMDFKTALQWLGNHFPNADYRQTTQSSCRKKLILPPQAPAKLPDIKHYLVHHRGISPFLIQPLIESGRLYADHQSNAVFLLLGKENNPVGAELRGTTHTPWRGMAPGSQKDLGCFFVPNSRATAIILCESAIDAISCFALYPCFLSISTSGARANPLWLSPLLCHDMDVYCGFDSDSTGDNMANTMMALFPSIKRLRPSQHDWNDVLKSHSLIPPPSV